MKKLSVLIALALCLTITGAYATWTYANGAATGTSTTLSIGMGTLVQDGDTAIGSFAITSAPTLTVEPKEDKVDYTTTLVVSGDLVITFTPSAIAEADIKTNGTPVDVTITVTGNGEYNEKILLKTTANNEFEGLSGLTITITEAEIKNALNLTGITLNSPAAHGDYAAVLNGYKVVVTVTPQ